MPRIPKVKIPKVKMPKAKVGGGKKFMDTIDELISVRKKK